MAWTPDQMRDAEAHLREAMADPVRLGEMIGIIESCLGDEGMDPATWGRVIRIVRNLKEREREL